MPAQFSFLEVLDVAEVFRLGRYVDCLVNCRGVITRVAAVAMLIAAVDCRMVVSWVAAAGGRDIRKPFFRHYNYITARLKLANELR